MFSIKNLKRSISFIIILLGIGVITTPEYLNIKAHAQITGPSTTMTGYVWSTSPLTVTPNTNYYTVATNMYTTYPAFGEYTITNITSEPVSLVNFSSNEVEADKFVGYDSEFNAKWCLSVPKPFEIIMADDVYHTIPAFGSTIVQIQATWRMYDMPAGFIGGTFKVTSGLPVNDYPNYERITRSLVCVKSF